MRTTRSSSGPDVSNGQAGKALQDPQPTDRAPSEPVSLGEGTTGLGARSAPKAPSKTPGSSFPVHKAARAVLNVWRGANVQDALQATGIPRPTWYQWLQLQDTHPDGASASIEALTFAARLRHAFARAQGLVAVRSQRLLLQAARSSVGTLDWRAAHEHLKHAEATRKRWHEYRELKVEQGGTIDHVHRLVDQMTEAEYTELLPDEWRELLPEHATSGQ